MKRFITLIGFACALLAAWAQHPMVTLSHDGELTFFTTLTAFEDALDAAENGDTLYLSDGSFYINEGEVSITKRVSIVGTGYCSHLIGNVTINLADNPDSFMDVPLFDGVRIDTLIFPNTDSCRDNLNQSEIRRCWIQDLQYAGYAGKDIRIDSCLIDNADFSDGYKMVGQFANGNDPSVKLEIRNSKIKSASYLEDCDMVLNSNIGEADHYPQTLISSILDNATTTVNDNATYQIINSLLTVAPVSSKVITDNCYFEEDGTALFNENLECTINLAEKGYLGNDGTVVGIYGGDMPFSENPSVPTVDSKRSSVQYDPENNKLKVNITVAGN